ncbi:MAG: carbohydrate ABC transporter permease [Christensenellales bacterium]|jgi:putative aldouronate transport system permease protein
MSEASYIQQKITNPKEDKLLYAVVYSILFLFALCILYPIIFIISASFSDGTEVQLGRVYLLPVKPTLDGYQAVFSHKNVLIGFRNTLFYTLAGTAINIIVTLLCAYPLSRKDMPFRGFFMFLFVFTMFFSGGLIPSYLLVTQLRMINTVWALLLPGAMSVYNMIITRTFFDSNVPVELLEASQIDGCSDARYFFSILLPLSHAVVAVIALFYAVGHWNAYFSALIYIRDPNLQPLQLILRNILLATRISLNEFEDPDLMEGKIGLEYLVKYALIVVSSAPIIALYPFIQKFFVKGVMIGSIKG